MRPTRILTTFLALIIILIAIVGSAPAQESETLTLTERGPYGVGWYKTTFIDESRESRELPSVIWYPAIIPDGQKEDRNIHGLKDAEPDSSGEPYPLIIYSHGHTGGWLDLAFLKGHLASLGFVVVAMDHLGDDDPTSRTNRPLDILYMLDQMALDDGLADMIDTNNVGVIGLSDGAYTALATNGSQLDLAHFIEWYEQDTSRLAAHEVDMWIKPLDEIVAYRAQFEPPLETGQLWPPFSDERIRAVMAVTPCWGPLFGEQGLSVAYVPTFLMGAVKDEFCPYERDAVFIFENLGVEEKFLLSFINEGHLFFMNFGAQDYEKHFATAFFGYYLQGHEDYAAYFTAEYVEQFKDLVWGPVETEQ